MKARWYYLMPCNPYAYGPTSEMTYKEARKEIKIRWNFKRLPRNMQIWQA